VVVVTADSALDAFKRGDSGEARSLAERRLAGGRIDAGAEVAALCMLSRVALREDDAATAAAHAELAHEKALRIGELIVLQEPVHLRAAIARLRGDLTAARKCYLASIDLNVRLGNAGAVAVEQRNLAYVEFHLGEMQEVRYRLAIAHEGARRQGGGAEAPNDLLDAALLAAAAGDLADTAALLQRTRQRYTEIGQVPDPDEEYEMHYLARLVPPAGQSQP
jgi:hypothetical protein